MNREYQLPAGTRRGPEGPRVRGYPFCLARTLPVKRVGPVRVYPPGTRLMEIRVLPLIVWYTRCLCGQNRVPFYFSVRHAPRAPSDWPTPATTRRWPHFRRVDPILAARTQLSDNYTYPTTPLPENVRAVRPHRPNGPPRTI